MYKDMSLTAGQTIGQLGTGDTIRRPSPVSVAGLPAGLSLFVDSSAHVDGCDNDKHNLVQKSLL